MTIGDLSILYGTMMSGKSLELIRRCIDDSNLKRNSNRVVFIRHSSDTRDIGLSRNPLLKGIKLEDHGIDVIVTDDLKTITGSTDTMSTIYSVYIDEGQFFGTLKENVELFIRNGINVNIAGLTHYSNGNMFGDICDLIPLCSPGQAYHMHAKCWNCLTNKDSNVNRAIFNLKLTHDDYSDGSSSGIIIDSGDVFKPVCRQCFYELR